MTEPPADTRDEQPEPNNLHPGQHDEGGHGGMATRELEAHGHEEQEPEA